MDSKQINKNNISQKKSKSKSKSKNKSKPKSTPKKTNESSQTIFSIYLGTYEGKIIVNNINIKTKENISNFSFTSSQNAIRTIYHKSGSLFVSGTDEIIHMFDVTKKVSEGDLMTYSGSINDIKINKNYLIVAGENNTIPIWRMSDFNNIIELKGHKKAINSIDIHSSGGILVSASRDKCVIIFDLLTGRKIEKIEFDYICNKVELFDKDKYLMVLFDLHVFILDLMKNSNGNDNIIQKLNFNKKILNAFVVKNKLLILFTDGEIITYKLNIKDEENINEKKESEEETNIEKDTYEEGGDIININSEIKFNLEKPDKKNENDLDIKARFVSISKIDKIRIITISYSNNEVYFYDLNKIIKYDEIGNKKDDKNEIKEEKEEKNINYIKKYGKIEYNIPEKITALDSELKKA
jgi:WD40 repeat protein